MVWVGRILEITQFQPPTHIYKYTHTLVCIYSSIYIYTHTYIDIFTLYSITFYTWYISLCIYIYITHIYIPLYSWSLHQAKAQSNELSSELVAPTSLPSLGCCRVLGEEADPPSLGQKKSRENTPKNRL